VNREAYTYPDGKKYEGEWKGGMRHGQGILTRPDGMKYEGEWKDNKPNGWGTLTYPDGKKRIGEWKDGKFIGDNQPIAPQKERIPELEKENQELKHQLADLKNQMVNLEQQVQANPLPWDGVEDFASTEVKQPDTRRSKEKFNLEHPVISKAQNPDRVSRIIILRVIGRYFILIPHFVILSVWGFLAIFVLFFMWVLAIFTARYPDGMYNFVMGYMQKILQVQLFVAGLSQRYPPFNLGGGEFENTN